MNRVVTAGLIGGVCALLAACSSGEDDGILSMNPGVGASGSGGSGSPMQLPPGTGGTTASGGSTAPAPSAGMTGGPTAGSMVPMQLPPMAGSAGPSCGDCKIPPECQGFPLEGLKYSPGGTTLPNKCMPFHPTTNNPYAVRCI